MKLQILGKVTIKEHTDSNDTSSGFDEGGSYHKLYFIDENNNYFYLECSETYGSCYSGYTSASYADYGEIITIAKDKVPSQMDKCKGKIFVDVLDKNKIPSKFLTTDGRLIFNCDPDGGCGYYSSGSLGFNEMLFTNNPRILDKKRIYILSGISNSGKSTIAHKIWDKVLESDSEKVDLTKLVEYDAIVIGNKNAALNKAIYTKIKKSKILNLFE